MPATSRLSLRAVIVATALAAIAATATYVVLADRLDGGGGATEADDGTVTLTPAEVEPGGEATFTTFDGDDVRLDSLVGRPLVVNFFASTCVPCVTEMPAFEEVYQELGDQVSFLGLAVADRPEEAQALVERTGVTYPTAQDRDASVITTLGGTVLPTTAVLDDTGEVLTTHAGALDADGLRALLADTIGVAAEAA